MKNNIKTLSMVKILALLCFSGLSCGVFGAATQSGSCPAALGHHHMGHGMAGNAEMDMSGSEITAGGKLAEAQCSNCHGRYGISISDTIPNLAGQESMYLCARMDGCRKQGAACEGHEDIAGKLSDQDIVDLSEFYAHLPANKW
jgi:cytochrome c553